MNNTRGHKLKPLSLLEGVYSNNDNWDVFLCVLRN